MIGDHPALGCWNTARYLKMTYVGCYDWLLSVDADAIPFPLEYKYVVVDDNTHGLLAWEEGDNRVIDESFLLGSNSVGFFSAAILMNERNSSVFFISRQQMAM